MQTVAKLATPQLPLCHVAPEQNLARVEDRAGVHVPRGDAFDGFRKRLKVACECIVLQRRTGPRHVQGALIVKHHGPVGVAGEACHGAVFGGKASVRGEGVVVDVSWLSVFFGKVYNSNPKSAFMLLSQGVRFVANLWCRFFLLLFMVQILNLFMFFSQGAWSLQIYPGPLSCSVRVVANLSQSKIFCNCLWFKS